MYISGHARVNTCTHNCHSTIYRFAHFMFLLVFVYTYIYIYVYASLYPYLHLHLDLCVHVLLPLHGGLPESDSHGQGGVPCEPLPTEAVEAGSFAVGGFPIPQKEPLPGKWLIIGATVALWGFHKW